MGVSIKEISRPQVLVTLGVPIDPTIIAYNTREAIENPEDDEARMIYDMMLQTAQIAHAAAAGRQGDEPMSPIVEVPDDDGEVDWVSFDDASGGV